MKKPIKKKKIIKAWAVVEKDKVIIADVIDRFNDCPCQGMNFDGFAVFKDKKQAVMYKHDSNEEEKIIPVQITYSL